MPNQKQLQVQARIIVLSVALALVLAADVISQQPEWTPRRISARARRSVQRLNKSSNGQSRLRVSQESDAVPQGPTLPDTVIPEIEFNNENVDQMFRLVAGEVQGVNVTTSQSVSEIRGSIYLRNVTFRQFLEVVTRQFSLVYEVEPSSSVIMLFTEAERKRVADRRGLDIALLESQLRQLFPSSNLRLKEVGNGVAVHGEARDSVQAENIIRLVKDAIKARDLEAEQDDSRDNTAIQMSLGSNSVQRIDEHILTGQSRRRNSIVVNLLRIRGPQQVTLRVVVAEVNRDAARRFGFSGQYSDGKTTVNSTIGPSLLAAGAAAATADAAGNLSAILDSGKVRIAMSALRENNLAKTLAEPTLTAMNGEVAKFHAGGQFPVPSVAGFGAGGLQGVEYVPFGVKLRFQPLIVDRDSIRLALDANVSTRNTQTGTTIGGAEVAAGTDVPGIDSREVTTTVQLRDGETLAIAGLIQSNQGGGSRRIPLIGDVPVLGRLASSDRASAGDQELIILVTPELVTPVAPQNWQPLPGADVFEPDDEEFYLRGQIESRRGFDYGSTRRTDALRRKSYYHESPGFQNVATPRQLP